MSSSDERRPYRKNGIIAGGRHVIIIEIGSCKIIHGSIGQIRLIGRLLIGRIIVGSPIYCRYQIIVFILLLEKLFVPGDVIEEQTCIFVSK